MLQVNILMVKNQFSKLIKVAQAGDKITKGTLQAFSAPDPKSNLHLI
jgi:hypothetical protein